MVSDVWETYQNPFYDQRWHYTVPYTVYTTGIGYRRDLIPDAQIRGMPNPYEIFWDTKFKGKVGIYDDYREAISMALLKNGITDLNTGNPKNINEAQKTLTSLINAVNVRTSINGVYIGIPKGTYDIHQAWSGDMVAAWQYTPTQNMKNVADARVLVPCEPQGHRLQRHNHYSRQCAEPGAGASLPRLDDDVQEFDAEFLLEWVSAAAAKGGSRDAHHDQELLRRAVRVPVAV